MKLLELLKNHKLYIIWCGIYITASWFILGATWQSFGITLLAYAISVSIALSPLGEAILRFIEGARRPATKQEKDYLLSLYDEVYESAKEVNKNLSPNIKLFVSDKMFINAFAVGKKTICLTRGAIESFSTEELKGVMAHELGHIARGDTIALLLNVVGNGIFTLIIFGLRLIIGVVNIFRNISPYLKFLTILTKLIIDLMVIIFLFIGEIILSIDSRKSEYQADMFAHKIGYGSELTKALYLLQSAPIPSDTKLLDRLRQRHPHLAYRIEKLETAEDEETEQINNEELTEEV
jgi:heat shock protein HtpX